MRDLKTIVLLHGSPGRKEDFRRLAPVLAHDARGRTQSAGLRLVDEDAAGLLSVSYAPNFFESDQRPLRSILLRVTVPTLIVHGTDDTLVPTEAAREHHRLVPQTDLVTLDGDHLLFEKGP